MIDLVFQNLTDDKSFKESFFKRILDLSASELDLSREVGASLSLVGEERIKELNNKHRHKNKITDVLSFPMQEKLEIRDSRFEIYDLGDIFICLAFAKKQAKSENISIDRKLAQLTVHGFLHLAGYDHEKSEKDEKEMFKLEEKILDKCLKAKD